MNKSEFEKLNSGPRNNRDWAGRIYVSETAIFNLPATNYLKERSNFLGKPHATEQTLSNDRSFYGCTQFKIE